MLDFKIFSIKCVFVIMVISCCKKASYAESVCPVLAQNVLGEIDYNSTTACDNYITSVIVNNFGIMLDSNIEISPKYDCIDIEYNVVIANKNFTLKGCMWRGNNICDMKIRKEFENSYKILKCQQKAANSSSNLNVTKYLTFALLAFISLKKICF
ncbi:uncharacterized protein LOC129614086 [Condylostylus longicornis]|uniref:uncharacterized protein LOC129614086 n=1 Tax=Condylostylus longicornis TaxID=2530218 RepID=UPI00244E4F57|nr:uncharacterized protein LOC129614086 [Condylostylus longicornis]